MRGLTEAEIRCQESNITVRVANKIAASVYAEQFASGARGCLGFVKQTLLKLASSMVIGNLLHFIQFNQAYLKWVLTNLPQHSVSPVKSLLSLVPDLD